MTRRRVALEAAAVLGGYLLLAVAVTWPLVLHLSTRIPGGGYGGDPVGYLWDVWHATENGLPLIGTGVQDALTAPFGRPVVSSTNTNQILTFGPAVLFGFWTPAAGINAATLLGLVTSSAAMYALVRWLGLGWLVAAWAGVAYMVFPYHLAKTASHLPLTQIACFPLVLLAGLWWMERPSWRRSAGVAGAFGVAWLSNPYYGVMCAVMLAVIGVWALVRFWRAEGAPAALRHVGRAAAAVVVLVGVPLAVLFLTSRSGVGAAYGRSLIELEVYGARVGDYVLPAVDSSLMRDLVGEADWAAIGRPGGERTNFVGWLTLALAAAGLYALLRRRGDLSPRVRTAGLLALPLLPVLLVLSLASPYRIGGAALTMPSRVVYEALPYIRVFARFVAPLMAVLIVLGAIGLALLLRERRRVVAAAIATAAIAVSLLELPNGLPVPSDIPVRVDGGDAATLPAWLWLRDNDRDALVIETPAYTGGLDGELADRVYQYGQTVHGHPIANGGLNENTVGSDFASAVGDPTIPNAARKYATVGIRYVTVTGYNYRRRGMQAPDPAAPLPGFEVAAVLPDSAVWRVVAPPADGVAVFRRVTWWNPEWEGGVPWRWMRDEAAVAVWVPRAGRFRLAFRARGYRPGASYPLEVRFPDGRTATVTVPPRGRAVVVEADLPAGTSEFRLVNRGPAAEQISASDVRVVSVKVSDWSVVRTG